MSTQEVVHFTTFIKHLNNNEIKSAQKMIPKFSSSAYESDLKLLIIRFEASQKVEEEIERLLKKNNKLQDELIEYKKKKGKQEFGKQIASKSTIMGYLATGNFEAALKESYKCKIPELQTVVHDVRQYRWVKQSIINITQSSAEINFSKDTKHIKSFVSNKKHTIAVMNGELARQLMQLYINGESETKLSRQLFTKEVHQTLSGIRTYMQSLKKNYQEQLQYWRQLIVDACRRRGINIKKEQFETTSLLKQLIKSTSPNSSSNEQLENTLKSSRMSLNQLVTHINDGLHKYDFGLFQIKNASLQGVFQCFCSLLTKLMDTQYFVNSHKDILQNIGYSESQVVQKLMKITMELKVRMPAAQPITKLTLTNTMQIFDKNISQFIILYDEMQKKVAQHQQEKKFKEKQQVINEQSLIKTTKDNTEVDKLLENNQLLKKELEQAFKIIAQERRTNQKLRQKVKTSNSVQSSYFLTPQFIEDSPEAQLRDQINALRIQCSKLELALQQQKILNSQFEQRLAHALEKVKLERTQQLQRQKQRYAKLRAQMEDANEQISQLNKMLEDQLFSSKRATNDSVIQNKESIVQQPEAKPKAEEKKTFISMVVQASVILESADKFDNNEGLQKIRQLEQIVEGLRQMMQAKDGEYRKGRIDLQTTYSQEIAQLKAQNVKLSKKIEQLKAREVAELPQKLKFAHIFPPGFIFDYSDSDERQFLIDNLVSYLGNIRRSRLLFRADPLNKTNFHRYIDGHKNIVLIIKTIYGKLIAGYSQQAFVQGATKHGFGLILSLWGRRVFRNKDKRAIAYDDYYVLFGNSQLRLKSQEFKVFSNFGIANGYYESQGEKVHVILGEEKEREVEIAEYEIYALDLEE